MTSHRVQGRTNYSENGEAEKRREPGAAPQALNWRFLANTWRLLGLANDQPSGTVGVFETLWLMKRSLPINPRHA